MLTAGPSASTTQTGTATVHITVRSIVTSIIGHPHNRFGTANHQGDREEERKIVDGN
jgi:hypothetical protein